ncbi:TlpA disulfide reductase family protein [Novosphingobium sp.]|uniref:TlpA disulfide reductase family protein n=1 Tax=Novosphingobium sp. TaxID=1874826 RepID=UPI0026357BE6|nr:TlpA disulfide reductase family protein [Novosphingobium sp.]
MTAQLPVSRRTVLGGLAGAALAGLHTPAEAAVSLDMAKYRGKVVYVDFWASWCGPCKLSFPFMQQLAGRYPASDLAVVTINVDRQRAAADAFMRQVHSNLPVIYDAAGDLAQAWKVADMPTSLVFDRKGVMRFRHQGFFPGKVREYEGHVAQLVREG